MLMPFLKCDLCGARIEGEYGEHGHTLRCKARDAGWRQGQLYGSKGGLNFIDGLKMDFCPACVRKEYERRALRPQTA